MENLTLFEMQMLELQREILAELRNLSRTISPTQLPALEEKLMTRQEVVDYLKISESTYLRRLRDGRLNPIKKIGGDRFYKSDLIREFQESKRRGRI
ncbi:helix-turn-helix domain-containing protein [Pedobacter insulae]|uniref:Helix-turn-helix domain-containing protein n=1 Tax=Pedobacter insulae TaxID=414048 RepID=A0A1I3ANW7_9SPHI|nr:helix-turn-helix domain-containing protein [Pedobacter insulae]SFH51848.1 Helix-turn-helix domain-containing protein [Pedobacter insulae]